MGILDGLLQKVHKFHRLAERELHDLSYLFFEVTQLCNLECLHCGSDCRKVKNAHMLPKEVILDILKEIKQHYNSRKITVVLTGGEPMCYPEIFELGRNIYELEFPWGMVTNGLAWNDKTFEAAIQSGLHTITVSLDGFEEDHNWLRGNDKSFSKAVALIKMLTAQPFYKGFDVITCVNKRNLPYIEDFYKFLKILGVTDWRITTIAPIGRAVKNEDLFLTPQELTDLLDWIQLKRENNDPDLIPAYSGCDFFGTSFEGKIRSGFYFCRAGINVGGIMANGDILACPNIDRRFSQGNVLKGDSFISTWREQYSEFRNRRWMKTGICASCDEWNNCEGNNFHLRSYNSPEPLICYNNQINKN